MDRIKCILNDDGYWNNNDPNKKHHILKVLDQVVFVFIFCVAIIGNLFDSICLPSGCK